MNRTRTNLKLFTGIAGASPAMGAKREPFQVQSNEGLIPAPAFAGEGARGPSEELKHQHRTGAPAFPSSLSFGIYCFAIKI